MKRNILAIAIPALLAAGAANAAEVYNKDGNKVDIYGRVYAYNYIAVGSDGNTDDDGDKTSARLGFRGETQIAEDFIGYGRFEWQTDTASSDDTRYAFAGFKFGQYGSFDYGKNDGVLKVVTSYTDVLPEFGGDSIQDYSLLTSREKAVATYRNAGFFGMVDGLNFAVQYQDQGSAKNSKTRIGTSEAYGIAVEYLFLDAAGIAAGYARNTDKDHTWNVGAKYDANNLYVAAMYTQTKFDVEGGDDTKLRGYEVVAQYGFNFENGAKLTPSVAYVQGKDKTKNAVKKDLTKYVELGASYDFNKNMSAIVDYKFNRIKDTDDTLSLGVIYRF